MPNRPNANRSAELCRVRARRTPPSASPLNWARTILWLLLILPACALAEPPRPVLELDVHPAILHADGAGAVTIRYHVTQESVVSLALHAADGAAFVLRDRVPRGPGTYAFSFRGALGGRVLPNGAYTLVATARKPYSGEHTERRQPLTIANADTRPPVLEDLHVTPAVLTPNQDGVDDRLEVRFTVAEPVTVDVRLLAGNEARWLLRDAAAGAGAVLLSWPPPLRHAPQLNRAVERLPAGPAQVEVTIQDRAGNRSVQLQRIALGESGTPRAHVTDVKITPAAARDGGTLTITATITNTGAITLRAAPVGPAVYAWRENAHTLGYAAPGTVRWGVDFSLNRSGIAYPFRWSLGRDLPPGESIVVSGSIGLSEDFPQESTQLWVGVIHEHNRMLADKRGVTRVQRAHP